jgi:hypothetical protein
MPEENRQDPANTQMFRAFVERGDMEKDTRRTRTAFLVLAAVVVVALIVVLVLAVS